jgi:major type 1 subunit fimbrin (pilin)
MMSPPKFFVQWILKRLFAWVVLALALGAGGAAYAAPYTPTNGLNCASNPTNGPVSPNFTYSPAGGNYVVSPAKNSPANPIVTITVSMNLTGCTLKPNTDGGNSQAVQAFLPASISRAQALSSPMSGISVQITGTPTMAVTGANPTCSGGQSAVLDMTSAGGLTMLYASGGSPTIAGFTGCNVSLSYTLAFFANSTLNSSNANGSFDTSKYFSDNATCCVGYPTIYDIGWGLIGSLTQIGHQQYSYLFSGGGFMVKVISCTPAVGVNGTKDGTITLPVVSSVALNGAGKTAGSTPFTISLKDCYSQTGNGTITEAHSATATWNYTPYSASFPNVIANIDSTPAAGVGIQITENTSGSPVLVNGNMGATVWNIQPNGTTASPQTFNAMYYSTGTTNLTGNVKGVANFTMTYN